jgi:hypothetical protein
VQKTTFTALEDAVAKAKSVYDARFLRMELTNDCIFKAYYADGTEYETDILKKLFYNGNVLLSESYAHGNTGTRIDEDTDNSMYYSKVSESEALNAKRIMENSEEILEEVKLHGVYTAFNVNFETGEAEYVSPSYNFKVNLNTGDLEANARESEYYQEVGELVTEWLMHNGVDIGEIKSTVDGYSSRITTLETTVEADGREINSLIQTTTEHGNELGKLKTNIEDIEKAKLSLSGGTMEGPLTLCENPTEPFHAVPMQYVDNNILHFKGEATVIEGPGAANATNTFYLPQSIDPSKYVVLIATYKFAKYGTVVRYLPWDGSTSFFSEGLNNSANVRLYSDDKRISFGIDASSNVQHTVPFDVFLVPMAECITLSAETDPGI